MLWEDIPCFFSLYIPLPHVHKMKDIYTSVSEKAIGHFLSGPFLIKFMANYEENVTGLCFEGDTPVIISWALGR